MLGNNFSGGWLVKIYDPTGKLADVPQADITGFDFSDELNGGSGVCTMEFARPFNTIGAVGYGYTVLIWFWAAGQTMTADPQYGGYILDFDQEQIDTTGHITAKIEGNAKLLDRAIVTGEINPGTVTSAGTNPNLDCGIYLGVLLATGTGYAPPNFAGPVIPTPMFNLMPTKFDGTKLGAAVDTLVKSARDVSGAMYTWFVRTKADLSMRVLVQADQNPNLFPTLAFKHLFKDSQFDQYKISTVNRDIVNTVAVYGGTDPSTGQQAYGVYQDASSAAAPPVGFGVIEDKISVPALQSVTGCQNYARVWLDLHAYPQAQGSARLLTPDNSVMAGVWVQIWETPATATQQATVKQVRVAQVKVSVRGERIYQTISTTAPVPYLDEAVYRLGQNVSAAIAIRGKGLPVNKQSLYIRAGGDAASVASSPAKVQLRPTEAVFPSAGIVRLAGMALSQLTDSVSGATGDGNYTISCTSSGTYVIAKGDRPANSSTQQNLLGVFVANGIPFPADIRTLQALPAFSSATPSLFATQPPTPFPTPVNTGQGSYDQEVLFQLAAGWDNTNAAFAKVQIGATPHGSAAPISEKGDIATPAPGAIIDTTVHGLSGGSNYDFYFRAVDNHDRPTAWVSIGTNAQNSFDFSNGRHIGLLPYQHHAPAVQSVVDGIGNLLATRFPGQTKLISTGGYYEGWELCTQGSQVISGGAGQSLTGVIDAQGVNVQSVGDWAWAQWTVANPQTEITNNGTGVCPGWGVGFADSSGHYLYCNMYYSGGDFGYNIGAGPVRLGGNAGHNSNDPAKAHTFRAGFQSYAGGQMRMVVYADEILVCDYVVNQAWTGPLRPFLMYDSGGHVYVKDFEIVAGTGVHEAMSPGVQNTLTRTGSAKASTFLNSAAGNIVGLTPDKLTYSAATTSANVAAVTWSWPAFTIYMSDGVTTYTVSAGSLIAGGLVGSKTYYFMHWYDIALGQVFQELSATSGGQGQATLPQTQKPNQDGRIGIDVNASASTPLAPSSGSTSGGGTPPPDNCPSVDQEIETLERGFIPARDLVAGMHVRDVTPGVWNRIFTTEIVDGTIVSVKIGEETFDVDIDHLWLRAGGDPDCMSGDWVRVFDLSLNTLIQGMHGRVFGVHGIGEPRPGQYVRVNCERHRFLFGAGVVAHNIIKTY